MSENKPSAWAIKTSRQTYLYGGCGCTETPCDLHNDIAHALDEARREGIEAAAKVCDKRGSDGRGRHVSDEEREAEACADAIRELLTENA